MGGGEIGGDLREVSLSDRERLTAWARTLRLGLPAALCLVGSCLFPRYDKVYSDPNPGDGGEAGAGGSGGSGPRSGSPSSGGKGTGGANTGGTGTGGANDGGADTGGSNAGGAPTGGTTNAGADRGGTNTGGAETGGSNTGAADTGGADNGGAELGGASTGGAATGGVATGGVATGGVATGGVATGGVATGGVATGNCMGDYLDSSPLMGYCFSFQVVGGTTTDGDVETDGLEFPYSLPGDSYDDAAMAGCNINQDADGGDPLTYDTTGDTGICVDGSGFQRIQIQVSETQWWCAKPDATGCAAWAEFNTACWDNSGTYYVADDGQPAIVAVAAVVPSGTSGPMTGTICIENMRVN